MTQNYQGFPPPVTTPAPAPKKSRAGKIALLGCGIPFGLFMLIVVIAAAAGAGGGSTPSAGNVGPASNVAAPQSVPTPHGQEQTPVPAPPAAPAGPLTQTGDGTYTVGTNTGDLSVGRWRTDGKSSSGVGCYWERERNTSGDMDAVIANDMAQGPSVFTVSKTDAAVKLSGGCTWTRG